MTASLAPVALFAYKRPDHLKATLEALGKNPLTERTDLHIFSDGPKTETDAAGVNAVRELLRDVNGFASVRVVQREKNLGLAKSIISGVSGLLAEHDSVIVLEDDLVTSPNFLAYMNDALQHYRGDPLAFSVTGHTFPASHMPIPRSYRWDTYAGYRCSSWSWGTWADRWAKVDWDMTYYDALLEDEEAQRAFNLGGIDMMELLRLQHAGRIDSWAIRFCYAHTQHGMRCMYPTKTLVKNIGLDRSGTHSSPEDRFTHRRLDETWRPTRFCQASQSDPIIMERFQALFAPKPASAPVRAARRARSLLQRGKAKVRTLGGKVKRRIFRPKQPAQILMANTLQRHGGAGRAAWRTFEAILPHYPDSRYLSLLKNDYDYRVTGRFEQSLVGALGQEFVRAEKLFLRLYPRRDTPIFSHALLPNPVRTPLSRFNPQLVHLHWVAYGMVRIEELKNIRCPVVWTLHDTWAFTGGCHYTGECTRFMQRCGHCPQLGSEQDRDLSRLLMWRKAKAYAQLNLTVVTPSTWLADVARQSSLLAGRRVMVIPNGLDTDTFKPFDQAAARQYLGVDQDKPVFLFGAQWIGDQRKGADLLCDALRRIDFPCTIMSFGNGSLPLEDATHITTHPLGSLSDDMSLALAYSAADVFVCPSREDNLPNTVAESLACGTPCAAFGINGLPDMIEHEVNGWLAKPFDPEHLAQGLRYLATHPEPQRLRVAARAKAEADYSLERMGQRYADLYAELLD